MDDIRICRIRVLRVQTRDYRWAVQVKERYPEMGRQRVIMRAKR